MASTVPPIPKLPVKDSPSDPKSTIPSRSLQRNRSISSEESYVNDFKTVQKSPKWIEPVKAAKETVIILEAEFFLSNLKNSNNNKWKEYFTLKLGK